MNTSSRRLFASIFLLLPALTYAQRLPAGYSLQEQNKLSADFDADGKPDFFAVAETSSDVVVYASLKSGLTTLKSKNAETCCSSIELKNGVVILHSKGMRSFSTWRFRYVPALHNFRMIGWDTESFGNAANDGSGTSSVNLLTGTFIAKYNSWNEKQQKLVTLPTISKKIKIPRRILLTDFGEDSDEWLSNLTHKLLPAAVQ